MPEKKFKFVDAQKLCSSTGCIKNNIANKNIEIGDSVKISNGKENFWVKVIDLDKKGTIKGIIKTELLENKDYDIMSRIDFRQKNIYEISKDI